MTSDFQKTVNLSASFIIPNKHIDDADDAELANYFKEYFYVIFSDYLLGQDITWRSNFRNVVRSVVSKYTTGEIDWSKVKVDLGSLCGAEVIELTVDLRYAIN